MAALYQKVIIDHYQHPVNRGRLQKPDRTFRGANISCGDELTFQIKLDKEKQICKVTWSGHGCVLSQAAASFFSEYIIAKTIAEVQQMKGETLLKKLHLIDLSPSRLKCALLPLSTIKEEAKHFSIVKF